MSITAHQTLLEIVDKSHLHAQVLNWFGIAFYDKPDQTLKQICAQRGLELDRVIRHLEFSQMPKGDNCPVTLCDYPVHLVIAYLKQSHRRFIRERLPYMGELIRNIKVECFDDTSVAEDLKFVFPLFLEDFIKHIFEEEKSQFGYILRLQRAAKGRFSLLRTYYDLEKNAIQEFIDHHHEEDDEMSGIRSLTNDYQITASTGTYTKVIYSELQAFEQELQIHANIEDNILFPKALKLENKVKKLVERKAKWN